MAAQQPTSLGGLIATAFLRAADPPPLPPPDSPSVEDPALLTLALIDRASNLANSLAVISDNEPLSDISTPSLRVLFLDSLRAHVELQVRTATNYDLRKSRIRSSLVSPLLLSSPATVSKFRKLTLAPDSQDAHRRFLRRLFQLSVLPPSTRALIQQQLNTARVNLQEPDSDSNGTAQNPSSSRPIPPRELKIALFKLERALTQSLDDFRKRYAASKKLTAKLPSDVFFDLLLSSSDPSQSRDSRSRNDGDDDQDDDEEDDEDERDEGSSSAAAQGTPTTLRQYLLLQLNLHAVKASSSLQSSFQELELLANMPPPNPQAQAEDEARSKQDAEWRLDQSLSTDRGFSGPLLDERGKPLRPFTILSSSAAQQANRQQLRDQVFQQSHRLPTMTIDEYLEEERRRGNIIEGGG